MQPASFYFTIILLSYVNSRGVKNSKTLQTILTIIKILSLAGLIVFSWPRKSKFDANWVDAWGSKSFDRATGSWVPIGGTMLISAISAALVGSIFSSVAWEGNLIAGEIKTKTQCGFELVPGYL
jgi:APA family basic amino acid/polyamine antiporter